MFARFRDENATISTGRSFAPVFLPSDHVHDQPSSNSSSEQLNSSTLDRVDILTLDDGRQLAWSEYGHRHGYPLIYLHREAGSRIEAKLLHESACAAGFRLIAVDRPGIGYSDFKSLNAIDELVVDYEQLIRHLGLKHVGLVSWGAGSALAMELARHLKSRISIVNLISPQRSHTLLPGVKMLRGCLTLGIRLLLSVRSRKMMAGEIEYFLRWREQLCYADRKQLDNPWVSSLLIDVARQSLRQGAAGAAQDLVLSLYQNSSAVEGVSIPVHDWSDDSEASVHQGVDNRQVNNGLLFYRHYIKRQGKLFINRSAADIFNVARQSLALSPVVCDPQHR